jgi:hypothetical protein
MAKTQMGGGPSPLGFCISVDSAALKVICFVTLLQVLILKYVSCGPNCVTSGSHRKGARQDG